MNMFPTIMYHIGSEEERQQLIRDGIIHPMNPDTWLFLKKPAFQTYHYDRDKRFPYYQYSLHTHCTYYTYTLKVNYKQFMAIYNYLRIIPTADINHLFPYLITNQRNIRIMVYCHGLTEFLGSIPEDQQSSALKRTIARHPKYFV